MYHHSNPLFLPSGSHDIVYFIVFFWYFMIARFQIQNSNYSLLLNSNFSPFFYPFIRLLSGKIPFLS